MTLIDKSNESQIDISVQPIRINIIKPLLFLLIYLILNYQVIRKMIGQSFTMENDNRLFIFNRNFWMCSLLMDIILMNINFNFSMNLYSELSEFFLIIFYV
jgi:hypothetical protein